MADFLLCEWVVPKSKWLCYAGLGQCFLVADHKTGEYRCFPSEGAAQIRGKSSEQFVLLHSVARSVLGDIYVCTTRTPLGGQHGEFGPRGAGSDELKLEAF